MLKTVMNIFGSFGLPNVDVLIRKKPMMFLGVSLLYLVVVGFLKWQIHPPLGVLWYISGGFIGVYLLDIAELFFKLNPSPFRSVLFQWLFAVVSFFIVTSSGSLLTSGLVLSLYLVMILWQFGEWQLVHNLSSWYRLPAIAVPLRTQQIVFSVFIAVFLFETFLFIR